MDRKYILVFIVTSVLCVIMSSAICNADNLDFDFDINRRRVIEYNTAIANVVAGVYAVVLAEKVNNDYSDPAKFNQADRRDAYRRVMSIGVASIGVGILTLLTADDRCEWIYIRQDRLEAGVAITF